MKHFPPQYPYWARRTAELYVLRVSQSKSFSVTRDGDDWMIRIPGRGPLKCMSMEACEMLAMHHVLNPPECDEDDDEPEDDGIPSNAELLREFHSKVM